MNHTCKTSRFKSNYKIVLNPINNNHSNLQNQTLQSQQINPQLIQNLINTLQISSLLDQKLRKKIIYCLQQFSIFFFKEQLIQRKIKSENSYLSPKLNASQLKFLQTNFESNQIKSKFVNMNHYDTKINSFQMSQSFQKNQLTVKSTFKISQSKNKFNHLKLQNKQSIAQSQFIYQTLQRINSRIKVHQTIIYQLKTKVCDILQSYKIKTYKQNQNIQKKKQVDFQANQIQLKDSKNLDMQPQQKKVQQIRILRQKLMERENQIKYLWIAINQNDEINSKQLNQKM